MPNNVRVKIQRDATGNVTKECADQFRSMLEQEVEQVTGTMMALFTSLKRKPDGSRLVVTIAVEVFEEQK